MNKELACSFFGHRVVNLNKNQIKTLESDIKTLIVDKGFSYFYFGGLGEFDKTCYEIVSRLKESYPHIKKIYCLIEEKELKNRARLSELSQREFDEMVYFPPDFNYWYTRIYYRNCEIIKNSDYVIFFAKEDKNSGAYKALSFAKKIKKPYKNYFE
mgnify:CR=1 FL=1